MVIKNDEYFMKKAIDESLKAFKKGEIPVGAIIVDNKTHEVISKGHNSKETDFDPTSHAEIIAIRKATKKRQNRRLNDCTMYVTLEPCLMCGSAILQSKIDRVVFALNEPETGAFGGKTDITRNESTSLTIKRGVLEEEYRKILVSFFKDKRN